MRPNCIQCKYFFVTWDKNNPKGCKYFNFKSKLMPSMVVFNSSGNDCIAFIKKESLK